MKTQAKKNGNDIIQQCKVCPIRGYSPEVCALHHKYLNNKKNNACSLSQNSNKLPRKIGTVVALGACAGALTSVFGVSAACLVGLKGLCETMLAAKVVAGGGVAGAVIGVSINPGDDPALHAKKRSHFVPPLS